MDENVFLHGVALANYRGIGNEIAFIGPFRRFNFMIGANNAGKSCILNFVATHLKPWVCEELNRYNNGQRKDLEPLDIHLGASRQQVKMGIGIPAELVRHRFAVENLKIAARPELTKIASAIVEKVASNDFIWLCRSGPEGQLALMFEQSVEVLKSLGEAAKWNRLWSALTNMSGGGLDVMFQ